MSANKLTWIWNKFDIHPLRSTTIKSFETEIISGLFTVDVFFCVAYFALGRNEYEEEGYGNLVA
jgi:hypothetical protein